MLQGTINGKYELGEFLGGAMSEVYAARDTAIGRKVAVKVLSEGGAADPEARARFLQEARIAGRMVHENVASVYDYGEWEGHPFMVLEFLEGRSLREAIRSGPLDRRSGLSICRQVALALDYIHRNNVIHRDVKPENINIGKDGQAKLMDFGIARAEDVSLTRPGYILGTPYYMAPEQVIGGPLSPQVDTYALGMVIYEVFTGNRPHRGEAVHEIFYEILNTPVDLTPLIAAGVPDSIIDAVEKCTAKDPTARPSLKEVNAILEQAVRQLEISEARVSPEANGSRVPKKPSKAPRKGSPFRNADRYESCIPLHTGFRFLHEPVGIEDSTRFAGRDSDLDELAQRILFADGGAFLVTGYRGVGKTSYVNQVVRQIQRGLGWMIGERGPAALVNVHLSLARTFEPAELMHLIIRGLYERLGELGLLRLLPGDVRRDLADAYDRTCFNMTRKLGITSEFSMGAEAAPVPTLGKFGIKLPFGYKRTASRMDEAQYLGYTDKAAEHDIIRLSRRLAEGCIVPSPRWRRIVDRLRRVPEVKFPLKLVFVFDELDKLTDEEAGQNQTIDGILRNLKTLFTTSGISFVFVAGRDLYDRWQNDVGRGDSVYESVFSYNKYLPCMWSGVGSICDSLINLDQPVEPECPQCATSRASEEPFCSGCCRYLRDLAETRTSYRDYLKYLSFRGRGIPRRILRSFNQSVRWHNDSPVLVFSRPEQKRHRLYAELWELLERNQQELVPEMLEERRLTDFDRLRLALFYLADRMLEQGRNEFTFEDVHKWSDQLSDKVRPEIGVADMLIRRLIQLLVRGDFLVEARSDEQHVQLDRRSLGDSRYRLAPRRVVDLGGEPSATGTPESPPPKSLEVCGPYQIVEQIGSGALARVYRAVHSATGRATALKIVESAGVDAAAAAQFRREARILAAIRHPHVVRYQEAGEDLGRLFIAMELIEGVELTDLIRKGTILEPHCVYIARQLASALEYLHERSLVRIDLKPANVLLDAQGRVCLIDLGLSECLDGGVVERSEINPTAGTPLYMAPEQFAGTDLSIRCDIYSLGIMLYEMTAHRRPFQFGSYDDLMRAHCVLPPPSLENAGISAALEAVIMRCLEKRPESRFQNPRELLDALRGLECADEAGFSSVVQAVVAGVHEQEQRGNEVTQAGGDPKSPFGPSSPAAPPPPPPPIPPLRRLFDEYPPGEVTPKSADPSSPPKDEAAVLHTVVAMRAPDDYRGDSATLVMVVGPRLVGTEFKIDKERITIGRGPDNDIVLDGARVSRFHAEISRDNLGGFWILDFNSANRTKLNGVPISAKVPIANRGRIQIGDFILECRIHEQASAPAA